MFNREPESRDAYANELQSLWVGSGYSIDSMHRRLQKDFTRGCDKSHDGSMALYRFESFCVVVSSSGYYFVAEIN